jgi:hypothetical protein
MEMDFAVNTAKETGASMMAKGMLFHMAMENLETLKQISSVRMRHL